jgi:hypothetical protein
MTMSSLKKRVSLQTLKTQSLSVFGFPHLFSCRPSGRQEKELIPLRSLRLCGADLI